ncbi:complex I assembly factor TIMMDC1, mitochondrial-like [Artemia franciscana]|uniref:complex I assembly factor TIMMDC1, mitochondrial-like n=1 Tax=Artemia franciscana TaxID=6661 RepID=UPI0032DA0DAF
MGNQFAKANFDILPDEKKTYLNIPDEHIKGYEAVKRIFTIRDHNILSPELEFSKSSFFYGFFTGGVIAGFLKAHETFEDFVKHHQATPFTSQNEAKRMLQNKITLNGSKAFLRTGIKLGLFTGSLGLSLTMLGAYRGGIGVLEFTVAGASVGGFSRLSLGPKGMISGALIGSFLGSIAGGLAALISKYSGMPVEEIIYKERQLRLQQEVERMNMVREKMRLNDLQGRKADEVSKLSESS